MDRTDTKLLAALQSDSSKSISETAQRLNLSISACHRRIRSLEERGFIDGYSARLDPQKLELNVRAFVEIALSRQSRDAMESFEAAVQQFPEILECHLMSGRADYILAVAARDLNQFDQLHRDCLSRLPGVSSMHSSFSIREIKAWRGYSLV